MKTYWSLNESVLWQTLYTLVDLERLRSVDCGWFHCGIFFFAWFFVSLSHFISMKCDRLHVYAPWRWTRKVEQHWWSILVLALSQPLTSKGNERVPLLLIEIFPILQKNILNNHTEKSVESAYLIYWLFFCLKNPCVLLSFSTKTWRNKTIQK